MTESDAQLVERANRGEADAFEALYRQHRDWVVTLAFRFTKDRDDALDVLQDVFEYFFAKFPGFELTASVRTLLYPAVKHSSLDRIRRRRATTGVAEIDRNHAQPPPTVADQGLARALDELSPSHREVILLRFADDMTLEQIARAVDAPLGTVKSRLHHALSALEKRLAKNF